MEDVWYEKHRAQRRLKELRIKAIEKVDKNQVNIFHYNNLTK